MRKSITLLACVIGLLLPSVLSSAMTIKAVLGYKAAEWQLPLALGGTSYQLTSPLDLRIGKTTVGQLTNLSFASMGDPYLDLNFSIHADVEANFFFDTGVLNFDALLDPNALATAAATITTDGSGGTLTGLFAGGKAYQATYNGGIVFADLIDPFGAQGNTSVTQADRLPPGLGFTTINGVVDSMRSQWSFRLTAGDSASGTSRFVIEPAEAIPDQGAIVLALTGAAPLLLGRVLRRSRRPLH